MVRTNKSILSHPMTGKLPSCFSFSNSMTNAYLKKLGHKVQQKPDVENAMNTMLNFLSNQWLDFTQEIRATWIPLALANNMNHFDQYISYNMSRFIAGDLPTVTHPKEKRPCTSTLKLSAFTIRRNYVELELIDSRPGYAWLGLLYRNHKPDFAPRPNDLIQAMSVVVAGSIFYTDDRPPARGKWYYEARIADLHGNPGKTSPQGSIVF